MALKLLEPLQIGDLVIRNRVVMAPMITNLGTPEGYPSDEMVAYYRERATEIGLIITEYTYVNNVDARGSANELGLYSEVFLPKFRRLTEAVHSLGGRVFAQLVHAGRKTVPVLINGNTPLAPSPVPLNEPVREMDQEDLARVMNDFSRAASLAERAGFDGIEIHSAHGYLAHQFLSPAVNKRFDIFGPGPSFLREVLKRVRDEVSVPVGVRVSSSDFDPQGLSPTDVGAYISEVSSLVDYVHLSAGRDGPLNSSAPFYYKSPSWVEEATVVRGFIKDRPLMVVGSVKSLETAEQVLKVADAVVVGRQFLADPHWLSKSLSGRKYMPCVRCNQSCRGLVFREVRCDVNPRLGWEQLTLPQGRGEVKVIGGGVAGMQASVTLAERGFSVVLVESSQLGGELNLYADPPKRSEFMGIKDYLISRMEELGVEVRLKRWNMDVEGNEEGVEVLDMTPGEQERSPPFRDYRGQTIVIDSNLYAYHDYALKWGEENRVFITEKSLSSLDMMRRYLLSQRLKEAGVTVLKGEFPQGSVLIQDYRREPPSVGKSMSKGFWRAFYWRGQK